MTDSPDPDLTLLLQAARERRAGAEAQLYGGVQAELQKLARLAFRREGPSHTLQPTALVNEAWIRLASASTSFEDRGHFFGIAARVMR